MDIVYIHGWGYGAAVWNPLCRILETELPEHENHFIDLGFTGVEQQPELPDNAVVIAHSLGVLLALKNLAHLNAPSYFIAINGFDCFFKHGPVRQMEAMQKNLHRKPWAQMVMFWRACGTMPFAKEDELNLEKLAQGLDMLLTHDAEEALKNLSCPVLALGSRDDAIVGPDMFESIWQDHSLVWAKDGGHVLPLSRPEWCADHIVEYVLNHPHDDGEGQNA